MVLVALLGIFPAFHKMYLPTYVTPPLRCILNTTMHLRIDLVRSELHDWLFFWGLTYSLDPGRYAPINLATSTARYRTPSIASRTEIALACADTGVIPAAPSDVIVPKL